MGFFDAYPKRGLVEDVAHAHLRPPAADRVGVDEESLVAAPELELQHLNL